MIASPFTCLYNVIVLKDSGNEIVDGFIPMNEADTCRNFILPKLRTARWDDDAIVEQMVLTPGRIVPVGNQHTRKAGLRPDYVLFIRRNIPIAVMEAKPEFKHPAQGLQQAMQSAEILWWESLFLLDIALFSVCQTKQYQIILVPYFQHPIFILN
jgi:hypothetical protein